MHHKITIVDKETSQLGDEEKPFLTEAVRAAEKTSPAMNSATQTKSNEKKISNWRKRGKALLLNYDSSSYTDLTLPSLDHQFHFASSNTLRRRDELPIPLEVDQPVPVVTNQDVDPYLYSIKAYVHKKMAPAEEVPQQSDNTQENAPTNNTTNNISCLKKESRDNEATLREEGFPFLGSVQQSSNNQDEITSNSKTDTQSKMAREQSIELTSSSIMEWNWKEDPLEVSNKSEWNSSGLFWDVDDQTEESLDWYKNFFQSQQQQSSNPMKTPFHQELIREQNMTPVRISVIDQHQEESSLSNTHHLQKSMAQEPMRSNNNNNNTNKGIIRMQYQGEMVSVSSQLMAERLQTGECDWI